MKNEKDFAAIWRKETSKPATVEREFDGLPCIARRVTMAAYLQAGKLPTFLAETLADAKGNDVQVTAEQLSVEDAQALIKFQRDLVCDVLEVPKVVTEDRPLQDGEVSYMDLVINRPKVIEEIMTWSRWGCPDVPVKLAGGKETTLASVKKFRKGGKRRAPSKPRPHV